MPEINKLRSLTPFEQHCERWGRGCGSALCKLPGVRVLLCRGSVPCDVLFCGEAPGESENLVGRPFVGPAGKLLDQIVARSLAGWQIPGTVGPGYNGVTCAFTNIVACIPRDPETGGKASEPLPDEIRQCGQRLAEFIALARPRLVVAVGALAAEWLGGKAYQGKRGPYLPAEAISGAALDDPGSLRAALERRPRPAARGIPLVSIDHPAYLLRLNVAMRGLALQRAVVTLRTAVEDMLENQ